MFGTGEKFEVIAEAGGLVAAAPEVFEVAAKGLEAARVFGQLPIGDWFLAANLLGEKNAPTGQAVHPGGKAVFLESKGKKLIHIRIRCGPGAFHAVKIGDNLSGSGRRGGIDPAGVQVTAGEGFDQGVIKGGFVAQGSGYFPGRAESAKSAGKVVLFLMEDMTAEGLSEGVVVDTESMPSMGPGVSVTVEADAEGVAMAMIAPVGIQDTLGVTAPAYASEFSDVGDGVA